VERTLFRDLIPVSSPSQRISHPEYLYSCSQLRNTIQPDSKQLWLRESIVNGWREYIKPLAGVNSDSLWFSKFCDSIGIGAEVASENGGNRAPS
jgi:hypothetical protein